ncbi:MAG: hypothetical protein JJE19_05230 [Methanosarcinales archaeon]|nr:hypothetical protein [Methanosarcinales archaeon]
MKTKTIRLKEKFADELARIVEIEGKTESETIREIFDFGLRGRHRISVPSS